MYAFKPEIREEATSYCEMKKKKSAILSEKPAISDDSQPSQWSNVINNLTISYK